MAKGRRSRSKKRHPQAGDPKAPQSRSARPEDGPVTDDVVGRIEALRGQVREARAEAEARGQVPKQDEQPSPRKAVAAAEGTAVMTAAVPGASESVEDDSPKEAETPPGAGPTEGEAAASTEAAHPERSHGRRIALIAGLAVLVIAGVVTGVLAGSSGGGGHSKQTPIAAYLHAHVPAGTPVALIGPVQYHVPPAYPTVPVNASNLSSVGSVRYAVSPDPLISAGPEISTFVLSHATLVVTDAGRDSLWAVGNKSARPSAAPSTAPATTAPPVTASPATTSTPPAATSTPTAPASSASPASPASPTRPAAPSSPAGTSPAGTPSGGASPGASTTATVQPGQSFWSIAQSVVQQRLGTTPTTAQVAQYWVSLVAANRGHLPIAGNPDLIYTGTTLVLPAG